MLQMPKNVLLSIYAHVQKLYPAEGAGFLLGVETAESRQVEEIYPVEGGSDASSDRYFIDARTVSEVEDLAEARSLTLIGIYHSHPEGPPEPSRFDLDWALPWYSYLITHVHAGVAGETCSWRLSEEGIFTDELLIILDSNGNEEEQWPPCISQHP
jgi:proteasome lid subunit RPN8/RPN11